MGKHRGSNKRLDRRRFKKYVPYYQNYFNPEIGLVPLADDEIIDEEDNGWYERLVSKRLANKIKNRLIGMRVQH